MKKISVILMVLSVLSALFGCKGQPAEPWTSLSYHVTSSVRTEGCHFALVRETDGSMTLSGYCFDGETEHRAEEALHVSQETVDAIESMALETAAKAKRKPIGMADGTQVTVTLRYSDGSEKEIELTTEQQAQLKALLQKELRGK